MFFQIVMNAESEHGHGTQYWWTGLKDQDDDHIWIWAGSKDYSYQNSLIPKHFVNPNVLLKVGELPTLHCGTLWLNQMREITIA